MGKSKLSAAAPSQLNHNLVTWYAHNFWISVEDNELVHCDNYLPIRLWVELKKQHSTTFEMMGKSKLSAAAPSQLNHNLVTWYAHNFWISVEDNELVHCDNYLPIPLWVELKKEHSTTFEMMGKSKFSAVAPSQLNHNPVTWYAKRAQDLYLCLVFSKVIRDKSCGGRFLWNRNWDSGRLHRP